MLNMKALLPAKGVFVLAGFGLICVSLGMKYLRVTVTTPMAGLMYLLYFTVLVGLLVLLRQAMQKYAQGKKEILLERQMYLTETGIDTTVINSSMIVEHLLLFSDKLIKDISKYICDSWDGIDKNNIIFKTQFSSDFINDTMGAVREQIQECMLLNQKLTVEVFGQSRLGARAVIDNYCDLLNKSVETNVRSLLRNFRKSKAVNNKLDLEQHILNRLKSRQNTLHKQLDKKFTEYLKTLQESSIDASLGDNGGGQEFMESMNSIKLAYYRICMNIFFMFVSTTISMILII